VRVFLREEEVIIPKCPIKEFYSQFHEVVRLLDRWFTGFSGKKQEK